MSSADPRQGERMILQEDCAEDKLKNGILTLTNQRIIFEETEGTMATLSKKTGNVVLDISLDRIDSVKTEGLLVKKVVISIGGKLYKFGVFSTGKWAKAIKNQIHADKIG
jgi:PH (Pleckstrin Homology) domain-containing protein